MKSTLLLFVTIVLLINQGYNCSKIQVNKQKDKIISESKLLQILRQYRINQPKASPRQLDFLADPSLLVTILHSLEIAYWSLPLGFVLMPLINFFRIPNRRRMLSSYAPSSPRMDSSPSLLSSPQLSSVINETRVNDLLNKFNEVVKRLAPTERTADLTNSKPSNNLWSSPATFTSTTQDSNANDYKRQLVAHLRNGFVR